MRVVLKISLFLFLVYAESLVANDLIEKGEAVYKRCQGCHQIGPDAENIFGPPLNGLSDRGAGAVEDYEYSASFIKAVEAGMTWDEPTLDAFFAKPMEYISGTKMAFAGIEDSSEREALIAFLNNFKADGSPRTEKEEEAVEQETIAQRPLASAALVPQHGVLHLGRIALDEEVQAWDIDIRADGVGLPAGKGDALQGVEIYDAQCAVCHGDFGEGVGRWPVLSGGNDTLSDERPEKTIGSYWPYLSTVFDYVRRAMPFGNARSLSDDEVYALTAYLLYLNDLAPEDYELSNDNFNEIRLPNEEGFIADSRSSESHYANSEEPCMENCIEGDASITQRARILDVTPDKE